MKPFANCITTLGLKLLAPILAWTVSSALAGEIIVDTRGTDTSSTGIWRTSTGQNPHGGDSLWSRGGAAYTWRFQAPSAGYYDVYMWWTVAASRADDAPVTIVAAGQPHVVRVNQRENGGQWNFLARHYFNAAEESSVTLRAEKPYPASYCADALRFIPSPDGGLPPALAVPDDQQVAPGSRLSFPVSASDTDGAIVSLTVAGAPADAGFVDHGGGDGTFTWDPRLEDSGSRVELVFTATDNSGLTATETVPISVSETVGSMVVNNGDPGTSSTGAWRISAGRNPHGGDSLWSRGGATYTWSFSPAVAGVYDVYMWWTGLSSRSTAAPLSIDHYSATETLVVNQRANGGRWNYIGSYPFDADTGGSVTLSAAGNYPVSYNADAVKFVHQAGSSLPPATGPEHIYIASIYGLRDQTISFERVIQSAGGTTDGHLWYVADKVIHFIRDIPSLHAALTTPRSHVIVVGHSNYGLGPLFATADEFETQVLWDPLHVDDERIFNLSSPWIAIKVPGMRTHQSYPNWWPVFQDGASAIMPYDFGDPRGDPPYNYYLTYRIPGDLTLYRIETPRFGAIERFSGSRATPFDPTLGISEPDPLYPPDRQYYITNSRSWAPSFESTGNWLASIEGDGFYLESYQYSPAGSGDDRVQWMFEPPHAGRYKVYAWWPVSPELTASAPYTIRHAAGSTTVYVDQRTDGGLWNELGEFDFDKAPGSVSLSNDVPYGYVVADAVRVVDPANDPPPVLQADFRAEPRGGAAPLDVEFGNQSTGDYTRAKWEFGDTASSRSIDSVTHTYSEPGAYTVQLTVTGPEGTSVRTKSAYIVVGQPVPLQAEFGAYSRSGSAPLEVDFRDLSSGNPVAWHWDFGDGDSSRDQHPLHTYAGIGHYTVTLTVNGSDGLAAAETKQYFVSVSAFDKIMDNVDYPKTHYGSRTILFRRESELVSDQLRYTRLLYDSCTSGPYYLGTFSRGTVFFTRESSSGRGSIVYLQEYLKGRTDEQIWRAMQDVEPVYDYYNFNLPPDRQ